MTQKKIEGYGKITEEALQAARSRIDVERVVPLEDWELEGWKYHYRDIRLLTLATGDYNPLYLDKGYAEKSPYGTVIAPPGMLIHQMQITSQTDGFPGMHALWRGITFEWKQPIRVGDSIRGKTYLREVEVKRSSLSRQSAIQWYETIATNQKGEEVGRIMTSWSRHERAAAAEKKSERQWRPLASYTPEDIERIREDYKKEVRRGAEPRYWEDVQIGEELPHVVSGPTNLAQRFVGEADERAAGQTKIGSGKDWGVAHAQIWDLFQKHPAAAWYNEQGIPVTPVVIHQSNERARRVLGLAGGYDAGTQRFHWAIHLLTNWQGDHGFLRKLDLTMNDMIIMGDTTWSRGKVTGKRIEDGKHIVDIEFWQENQLPRIVSRGSAEIVLLSRSNPDVRTWD